MPSLLQAGGTACSDGVVLWLQSMLELHLDGPSWRNAANSTTLSQQVGMGGCYADPACCKLAQCKAQCLHATSQDAAISCVLRSVPVYVHMYVRHHSGYKQHGTVAYCKLKNMHMLIMASGSCTICAVVHVQCSASYDCCASATLQPYVTRLSSAWM